jgi:hypothetical protein
MANGSMEKAEEMTTNFRAVGSVTGYISDVESYTGLWPASHPVLPRNAIATYLDEGASNIVYRLSLPPTHGELASFHPNVFPNPRNNGDSLRFWKGEASDHLIGYFFLINLQARIYLCQL